MQRFITVLRHNLKTKRLNELQGLNILPALKIDGDFDDLNSVGTIFNPWFDLTGRGLTDVSPPVEPLEIKDLPRKIGQW